jgi:hypothetical protein
MAGRFHEAESQTKNKLTPGNKRNPQTSPHFSETEEACNQRYIRSNKISLKCVGSYYRLRGRNDAPGNDFMFDFEYK